MKEYELIETYPDSPKLGTKVIKRNDFDYYLQLICNSGVEYYSSKKYPISIIENNPKFWKKIVESDYEILSTKLLETGRIFSLKNNGLYSSFDGNESLTLDDCLSTFSNIINSVRRLSDGEVFTIWDKAKTQGSGHLSHNIGSIEVKQNLDINRIWINWDSLHDGVGEWLENIEKTPISLFRTEDHIDIFEEDSYWCVNTAPHLWSLFEQTSRERTQLNKTVKAFSTKEKAEEFITNNKPLFSTKEVIELIKKYNTIVESVSNSEIEKIAKVKLNLEK